VSEGDPTQRDTVLFISLPAGLGGSARSLLTVLGGLEDRCRRVVARRPATTMARELDASGLIDDHIDLTPDVGSRVGRLTDAARLARWAHLHRARLAAIHANGLSELNLAVPAARVTGVPIVVWVHDWQISTAARRLAPLLRAAAPTIDWITVSEASRGAISAARLAGASPVEVVPNPIDPTDLGATEVPAPPRPGGGAPVIAYIGAPARYKGFHLLPEVIDAVRTHRPEVTWHIWSGPRTAEPEIWGRLAERADRGVVLHDKTLAVATAYAGADIVFCPSLEESFGRVAAEAMAIGRTVVASDLPALHEVLGDADVYFPRGDVAAAAAALTAVLDDPDRRRSLEALGLDRASDFSPAQIVEELSRRYGLAEPTRDAGPCS
jgi:glycosyltransferase involved in cell wall biosynthesis